MIKLESVGKKVAVHKGELVILNNINLSIEEGSFSVIRGQSGSGKSTLLNILGGLDNLTSGSYFFDDKLVKTENDRNQLRRKEISMIIQNFALIPNMSVIDNINLAKKDVKYADELMGRLQIKELKNKKVKYLSGGEKQRVAIVRALIKRPKLLLADEPTGSLDSVNSKAILQLLLDLNNQGLTIIMVTHDDSIANMVTEHYFIEDGELLKLNKSK